MDDQSEQGDLTTSHLPIESIPKTALQAIYHAVTGKTESMSKNLMGNVLIDVGEIDRLYEMLLDQLALHENVFAPTTTIMVKCANDKKITYSSWERFKALRVNNHDITSEITLRLEFVLRLPGTQQPQRCVVSINLDSSLPVVLDFSRKGEEGESYYSMLGFLKRQWRTATVLIDFVDFLVAKSFITTTEEWFSTLKTPTNAEHPPFFARHLDFTAACMTQLSRLGMAAFLTTFALLGTSASLTVAGTLLAVALALIIWAAIHVAQQKIAKVFLRRVVSNIVPTVILLTDADGNAYAEVLSKRIGTGRTFVGIAGSVVTSLALNIIASYIYAFMST